MHYNNISVVPPIIAHRGASALAPENTMAAFKKAKQCGLHWIEFDVTLAACGEVVVFHDDTLDRTTNGVGNINDFTYDYLKTLDAGSWFSSEFSSEKILTLREVLSFLKRSKMAANIEIKSLPGREALLAQNVLTEIQNSKIDNTLLLTSFSIQVLHHLKSLHCSLPLGFLMSEWNENIGIICDELSLVNIGVDYTMLAQDKVRQLKSKGQSLFAYTVNDPSEAKKLFAWGVDAIFSDCAQEMLSVFL